MCESGQLCYYIGMEKNYIATLREKFGHAPLLSVGCGCLIINEKGQILLEKRKDNGLYCLPGGAIELGESVEEGLRREIKEETGIILPDVHFLMAFSGEKEKLIYPNGDIVYYVDFIYYAKVDSKTSPTIGDGESTLVAFFDKEKLPPKESFLRGNYEPIEKYFSGNLEPEVL